MKGFLLGAFSFVTLKVIYSPSNALKTLGGGQQGNDLQNNPIVNNISGDFMNNIMQKFALDSGAAKGIASSLIPIVMSKLIHKTNDPNDSSFNLESLYKPEIF